MNPVLEGLRFLGALMVMTHHAVYTLTPNLAHQVKNLHFFHTGADLFFVISGFLFAPFLLGEKEIQPDIFLKRRFFRVYPLYIISFILLSIAVNPPELDTALILEHLFLLNTLPYQTLRNAQAVSYVYWTLAVELQFYLFVVIFHHFNSHFSIKNKLVTLSSLAFLGFGISTFFSYPTQTEKWVLWQAQLPALVVEFLIGILGYHYLSKFRAKWAPLIVIVLGACLLGALYNIYPHIAKHTFTPRPFSWFNLLSALGYTMIMVGLLTQYSRRSHSLPILSKVCIFAGSLSYAVYLFHEAIFRTMLLLANNSLWSLFLAFIFVFVLSIPLHYWVEKPAREYGRRI